MAVDLTSKELLGTVALSGGMVRPAAARPRGVFAGRQAGGRAVDKVGEADRRGPRLAGRRASPPVRLERPRRGRGRLLARRTAPGRGRRHAGIRLWDLADGKELCDSPGHDGQVTSVLFSPDGARVATAAMDRSVRLWETAGGKLLGRFPAACSFESQSPMAFSPDGRLLVVDLGGPIALVESGDGKLLAADRDAALGGKVTVVCSGPARRGLFAGLRPTDHVVGGGAGAAAVGRCDGQGRSASSGSTCPSADEGGTGRERSCSACRRP